MTTYSSTITVDDLWIDEFAPPAPISADSV
jgi:hypothetical protein